MGKNGFKDFVFKRKTTLFANKKNSFLPFSLLSIALKLFSIRGKVSRFLFDSKTRDRTRGGWWKADYILFIGVTELQWAGGGYLASLRIPAKSPSIQVSDFCVNAH